MEHYHGSETEEREEDQINMCVPSVLGCVLYSLGIYFALFTQYQVKHC